ncbi:reticulon-like protein B21 [Malania oleifera]|uniref:reticulon-like protein B21 n=1 Tax=Malania oleifera TaxID=397392 RepID=UPI0025AE6BCA|nr:reticulon-like protein B21 [Malania oleifera]
MDVGRRRGAARNGVVAGSVWESRMKIDEVKGGIKVFNGEENSEGGENEVKVPRRLKQGPAVGVSGRRKTWKSESFDGFERPLIQIAKGKTEPQKNCDEQLKELSASADGIKKSPIHRKTRSGATKELSASVDDIERSPIQLRKVRSEQVGESANEKKNSIQLRKTKSESNKVSDEQKDVVDGSAEGIEKIPIDIRDTKSEETCKEFGVYEEKVIAGSLGNVGQAKSPLDLVVTDDVDDNGDGGGVDGDEEDVRDREDEDEDDEEIVIEAENKSVDIKEINVPEQEQKTNVHEEKKINQIHEKLAPTSPNLNKQPPAPSPPRVVDHPKKPTPDLPNLRKPSSPNLTKPSIAELARPSLPNFADRKPSLQNLTNLKKPSLPNRRKAIPIQEEFHRVPETRNKLQNLGDLVMWRDVSKSALIFGIGAFMILSSSYTNDLNISLISVISYVSLVYLAAIFLFKSFISRDAIDMHDWGQGYVLGEEEAIWLLKLVLPYINEFLLKIRSLFSGDPATTMKLAVLLFVLARCGSSITIWKMVKLGFFGAFTIPKVYSSYSTQLTGYGEFWIRRFQDAWESCSHKKAVAGAIFTVVWNLSSVVARIWAVFVLFVAVRYYQQSLVRDDWVEDEAGAENSWQAQFGGQRQGHGPTIVEIKKEKKGS